MAEIKIKMNNMICKELLVDGKDMSNSCGVNITLLPCQAPKVTITFNASDLEYYCDKGEVNYEIKR